MSTTAKGMPPQSFQHSLASDLSAETALVGEDGPNVANGNRLMDRPGQAAKSAGVDAVPRDVCLGMAVGIRPAQLVTFAASFREVAPLADLVLFFEAPTSERFEDIIDK